MLNFEQINGAAAILGVLYFTNRMVRFYEFNKGIHAFKDEPLMGYIFGLYLDSSEFKTIMLIKTAAVGSLLLSAYVANGTFTVAASALCCLAYVAINNNQKKLDKALQPFIDFKKSDINFDPHERNPRISILEGMICGRVDLFNERLLNRDRLYL